jgi:transcriptional regulator with XRE-family HTH domain
MARAALELGVREIAERAGVSTNTITRLERGEALYPRTLAAIRAALEAAGVEFIDPNGGGPGVRLRAPEEPDSDGSGDENGPEPRRRRGQPAGRGGSRGAEAGVAAVI